MKCLNCGDNVCWVITKNTAICDKCGAEHTQEGLFWNCCLLESRAEKAEAELKAIKERIEAVTEKNIFDCLYPHSEYIDATIAHLEQVIKIQELIKQIGGVK